MKTRRAFVTGGSGFIGTHLIQDLLQRAWKVRALVHHRPLPAADGLEVVQGDIRDYDLIRKCQRDIDVVFHLASALGFSLIGREEFFGINAGGTETVLKAAQEAAVGRVVHFSSAGVLGHVRSGQVADENHPLDPQDIYDQSKLQTPVHIRDLLAGTHLCAERGRKGETYNLAGAQALPVRDIVAAIARAAGRKPPRLRLPLLPVKTAARLMGGTFSLIKKEAPLSLSRLAFFIHPKPLSIHKAADELDYKPLIEFEEGMRETVRWYRDNGWL
jgi:nucleoside-diphosphate-sugar epimerase